MLRARQPVQIGGDINDPYSALNYSVVGQHHMNNSVYPILYAPSHINATATFDDSSVCCNTTETYNTTANSTESPGFTGSPVPLWQLVMLGSLAGLTVVLTIIGNLIVILSFVIERQIRQPTNYFIASLAVSDLLIGIISMPFYTVYLLFGQWWPLGEILCDLWLSIDYTVCLTSIYTVFCITIDRFCSVRIPAKYRNWRSERKVFVMIACTWVIPITVFFTSIFGWQYFVGKRTVNEGKCYVQYLEEGLFNCILQVGYFWTTLCVMCTLYTGIYKVALTLQRKSDAKHKKMTSLVSMAGQTMTKIGIGMSQQQKLDTKKLFPSNGQSMSSAGSAMTSGTAKHLATTTTSFTSARNQEKEEDRSSSPAFPSDTEPSSTQSPKRSPKPKKEHKKAHKRKTHHGSALNVPKLAPPKSEKRIYKLEKHLPNAVTNGARGISSLAVALQAPGQTRGLSDGPPPDYNQATTNRAVASQTTGPNDMSPGACDTTMFAREPNVSQEHLLAHENDDAGDVKLTPKPSQSTEEIQRILAGPVVRSTAASKRETSPVWKKRNPFFQDEDEDADEEGCEDGDADLIPKRSSDSDTAKWSTSPTPPKSPIASSASSSDYPRSSSLQHIGGSPRHSCSSTIEQQRLGQEIHCEPVAMAPTPTSLPPPHQHRPDFNDDVKQTSVTSTNMTPAPSNVVKFCPGSTGSVESEEFSDDDPIEPLHTDADPMYTPSPDKQSSSKKDKRAGVSSAFSVMPYIRSMRKSKKARKREAKKQSKSENRARKALRTITIILGAFVLCWTPWHIIAMIIGFCPENKTCVPSMLYDVSYWLCYLNSPLNPFCYAFANQQFKKTFVRIIKLDWHRT